MAITNGYATLAQLKSALKIIDSLDDDNLERAIASASRLIDGYAGRYFYNTTATRIFTPDGLNLCQTDDLVSITTLKTSTNLDGVFDLTWTTADYQAEPVNAVVDGTQTPITRLRAVASTSFPVGRSIASVQVTGVFGWSAVPDPVNYACIIQASRLWKRLDSPLGVAGFGDMGVVRVSTALDADVRQLIDPYRKVLSIG